MAEKKLSEELRHCLEDESCRDCLYHAPETKLICKDLLQKAHERIKEYEDLEEKGKLLKLPCSVGDTLYFPYIDSSAKEKVISEEEVTEIGLYYRVGNGELSSCSEIGEIIFRQKFEAEAALQKV